MSDTLAALNERLLQQHQEVQTLRDEFANLLADLQDKYDECELATKQKRALAEELIENSALSPELADIDPKSEKRLKKQAYKLAKDGRLYVILRDSPNEEFAFLSSTDEDAFSDINAQLNSYVLALGGMFSCLDKNFVEVKSNQLSATAANTLALIKEIMQSCEELKPLLPPDILAEHQIAKLIETMFSRCGEPLTSYEDIFLKLGTLIEHNLRLKETMCCLIDILLDALESHLMQGNEP